MKPRVALLIIVTVSALLLFYRLGDLASDPDERAIIRWATDLYHSTPSLLGLIRRFIQDKGFYRSYPGLNIYLAVLSFKVFGVSTWAARLPSALIVLGTVPLFYRVADRMLRDRMAALLGTLTFATSAPILFLMRQCRYTSLTVFAALWLVWAYLNFNDGKRYSWLQCLGAMVLFFSTSYYIFSSVAVGVVLHCFLCGRGRPRWALLLVFIGTILVLSLTMLGWPILHDVASRIWHRPIILTINNLQLCANELNLIGLPYVLVVIFLIITRSARSTTWVTWTAGLLWGGFAVTSSSLALPLLRELGVWLDRVWPQLSPWVFNRLVDPRSWMMLCLVVAVSLMLRTLRQPSPNAVQRLSLPIIMIIGTTVTCCIVFPRLVWTRYLVSTIALSFIILGFLVARIIAKNRPLGLILLLLVISSNVLSVVPLTSGHYPYWQWKLPHWVYRLAVGDPCAEIVLNFWILPPSR